MIEEDDVPKDYLDSFNKGYTLASHFPDLAAQLKDISSSSQKITAFKEGIQQFNQDKGKALKKEYDAVVPEKPVTNLQQYYPDYLRDDAGNKTPDIHDPDKDKDEPSFFNRE